MELITGENIEYLDDNKKVGIKEGNAIKLKPIDAMRKAWKSLRMTIAAKPSEKAAATRAKIDVINDKIANKKEEIATMKSDITSLENKYHDAMTKVVERQLPEDKIKSIDDKISKNIFNFKADLEDAKIDLRKLNIEREKAYALLNKYNKKILKLQYKINKYSQTGIASSILKAIEGTNISSSSIKPVDIHTDKELENGLSNAVNNVIENDNPTVQITKEENGLNRVNDKPLEIEKENDLGSPESLNNQLTAMVSELKKENEEKAKQSVVTESKKEEKQPEVAPVVEPAKKEVTPVQSNLDPNSLIAKAQEAAKKVADYDRLSSDYTKLSNDNKQLSEENASLKTKANTAEKNYTETVVKLDREKELHEAEIAKKNEEIKSKDVKLSVQERTIEELTKSNTIANDRASELEKTLKEAQELIQKMTAQLSASNDEKQRAEQRAKTFESERNQAVGQLNSVTAERDQYAKFITAISSGNVPVQEENQNIR